MSQKLISAGAAGAVVLSFIAGCGQRESGRLGTVMSAAEPLSAFPQYDHLFLIINENHNYANIINNPVAPILNALARDYGSATSYTGVSDPSEPNYVAMLGGSDFGISNDDPYFFPGNTVDQPNLMSQLESVGKTWKAYFQDLPYAGYRGYCYPAKCNGIPDSDTQYVAKHNGIVNFANMRTPSEWINQTPYSQLATDLASGNIPNLSYIVGDECNDMHGAPPWCVDSGKIGDVDDTWLVAQGDRFVGQTVNMITSSSMWMTGNNAIVVTFDEGNAVHDQIYTAVITSHGPRGVTTTPGTTTTRCSRACNKRSALAVYRTAAPRSRCFPFSRSRGRPLPRPSRRRSLLHRTARIPSRRRGPARSVSRCLLAGRDGWSFPARTSATSTTTWRPFPPGRPATRGPWARTFPLRIRPCSRRWQSTSTAQDGPSTLCRTWD